MLSLIHIFGLSKGENKIELTLDMGNRMQTWSEFHPTLYALNVTLSLIHI